MLTPMQQRFVEEYIADGDAAQAAMRAGYAGKASAQRVLLKPEVQEAIRLGKGQKSGQEKEAMKGEVKAEMEQEKEKNEEEKGEEKKQRHDANLISRIISADYVVQSLMDTLERCLQARPVLDRSGKPVMVDTPEGAVAAAYTFDAQHALKASELLGKHLGLFVDKTDRKDGKDGKESSGQAAPVINLTLNKDFDQ